MTASEAPWRVKEITQQLTAGFAGADRAQREENQPLEYA
jgi:hypothetical protein